MLSEIEIWYKNFVAAVSPAGIFGKLPNCSIKDQEEWLKSESKRWLKLVHPDQCRHKPVDKREQNMCTEMLEIIIRMRDVGLIQIREGIYDTALKRSSDKETEFKISSPSAEYFIFKKAVEGDLAQIFQAERCYNGTVENVCLKVALDESLNDLLGNEAKILSTIQHRLMPRLLENFELDDGRAVNVMRWIEGGCDLVTLRKHFTNGLPQLHLGWIAERLLNVLGYLHLNRCVHSMIAPSNIMIVDYDPTVVAHHQGILIDYCYSIPEADMKGKKYSALNDFSAPELINAHRFGKKMPAPHPVHDIYSLGASLLYLITPNRDNPLEALSLPNDVFDDRLKEFLYQLVNEAPNQRIDDAWMAYHRLVKLRQTIHGKMKLQHLGIKI